ncbi:histidine phosphatase family protein [Vibrio sp. MA40-2]|uniref:histidine phosphatase family protein n=1 Tax=Vibrio sp. MA40-2 TaxID=3391828 RepID=UPI0039A4B48E
MTTTHIELLRHGLPEGDECFRGHTNFALTEVGLQQMQASTASMPAVGCVITSPLQRCYKFAAGYAKKHHLELIEKAEFMELNFGDWDGKPKQKIWDEQQDKLATFWAKPWQFTPPNGEPVEQYDQRIQLAWTELLQQKKGQKILLVTHGGVIKQILRMVLEMPKTSHYLQRLDIPYAARVTISVFHDDDGTLWPTVHWPSLANIS